LFKTEIALRQILRQRVSPSGERECRARFRDAGDDAAAPVFHDLPRLVGKHLTRQLKVALVQPTLIFKSSSSRSETGDRATSANP
jgi:hypothetical protein